MFTFTGVVLTANTGRCQGRPPDPVEPDTSNVKLPQLPTLDGAAITTTGIVGTTESITVTADETEFGHREHGVEDTAAHRAFTLPATRLSCTPGIRSRDGYTVMRWLSNH